ncbi:hypothetical protein ACFTWH_09160 [Streptomyces sp. NPDC057011]|uniref:hypothetical protein n=1 Tax=unclassified Streptomyces TaxID=2593676 RepID=UPI00363D4999
MRSISLPKSLLAAALGGVAVVAGFGTQNATAAQPTVVSIVAASDADAEMRFFELADLISQSCAVEDSSGPSGGVSASTAGPGLHHARPGR